ncbi:MAG: hypothetical protein J6X28_00100 [Bacilli bacterium]|nr:hypothetical protein [Bacilli bacterium]
MKNLLKMHKRIIGVVFVFAVFATFLFFSPVEALEYCKDPSLGAGEHAWAPESTLSGRYGINLESIGGNQFKLTMNPSTNKAERCKTSFTISQVNGVDSSISETLTCDHDVIFTETNLIDDTSSGLPGITVTLMTENIIKNEKEENSCVYKYGKITFETTVQTAPTIQVGSCPAVQIEDPGITIDFIDCDNKTYADGSFEAKFCYARKHAEKKYDDSSPSITNGKFNGSEGELTFRCNHDINTIPTNPDDLQGENYYVNKHYIYGKTVQPYNMGHYYYHYSPGEEVEGAAIKCEITCEESVEVEYGPPVASAAGMCFEYKVRVTSRVSCNMSKSPEPPASDCSYCTPSPHCVSSSGKVWLQGGPNEQFDACIQDCDGGKYTQKCSNKCYKKVYGKLTGNAKVNSLFLEDFAANQVVYSGSTVEECMQLTDENGKKYNPTGCYYRTGGSIKWKASGERFWYGNLETTGEGRWYTENPGGKYHNGNYIIAQADGFWRHNYGKDYCHDTCSWVSCPDNAYLNPGMAEEDYKANIEQYNKAVIACKGKATCTTTVSEFTISADYTKIDGTEVTIDFPIFGKDSLQRNGGTVIETFTTENSTLLPDEPYTGEGILGCYKPGGTETNLYRSTWGFPGTWMNLKTGEISFQPKTGSKVWYHAQHEFCIPGDAKAVNIAWTNAYFHKQMVDNGLLEKVSVTDTAIDNMCHYSSSPNSVVNKNYNITEDQITFNIRAKTVNFGYFNWEINIECFYGISNNPLCNDACCETDTCENLDPDCIANDDAYRVRSTDLENLFPSVEGEGLTTSDQAGRIPGFNWSEYAINNKNVDYASNPVRYMQQLQKLAIDAKASGSEVYTEDNLDYEFILSPATIRDMRKDAAGNMGGGNYTAFSDSGFALEEGVGRYRSQKIRDLAGENKVPDKPEINCNNMLHYGSNQCDPVHD